MQRRWLIYGVGVCLVCGIWGAKGGSAQLTGAKPVDEALQRLGRRVADFLDEVGTENLEDSVDALLHRSPLLRDTKRVTQLKESMRKELRKYGSYTGVELLKTERIGKSLVRCVCLYQCEDYPVIWDFTYYRSSEDEDWSLISVQFHVDYEKLAGLAEKGA